MANQEGTAPGFHNGSAWGGWLAGGDSLSSGGSNFSGPLGETVGNTTSFRAYKLPWDYGSSSQSTTLPLVSLSGVIGGTPAGPTVQLDGGTTGNVDENQPIGTTVGTISTANMTLPITFSFNGGTDDASFSIDGTDLKTAEIFDEDVKSSYSIDVLATDSAGPANTATNTFTITIDPVSEPGGAMFARGEVQTGLTLVGTLETLLDPSDASVTYGVDATTYHGALFEISGGASFTLHLKAPPSAGQVGNEYFVQVTPTGNSTGAYPPMLIKVTVLNTPTTGTVIRIR